jgi:hypothetical protein
VRLFDRKIGDSLNVVLLRILKGSCYLQSVAPILLVPFHRIGNDKCACVCPTLRAPLLALRRYLARTFAPRDAVGNPSVLPSGAGSRSQAAPLHPKATINNKPPDIPKSAGSESLRSSLEEDREHLLQGKKYVNVKTASKYLGKTIDHIRRLARWGKLQKMGSVHPIQISTESLKKYKLG